MFFTIVRRWLVGTCLPRTRASSLLLRRGKDNIQGIKQQMTYNKSHRASWNTRFPDIVIRAKSLFIGLFILSTSKHIIYRAKAKP